MTEDGAAVAGDRLAELDAFPHCLVAPREQLAKDASCAPREARGARPARPCPSRHTRPGSPLLGPDLKLSRSEVLSGPIHVTAARHPQKGFVKNSPAT
jgi:hypothetical protein